MAVYLEWDVVQKENEDGDIYGLAFEEAALSRKA